MPKYVDVTRSEGTDHLYLVNGSRCEYIDCSDADFPYFQNFPNDIHHKTQTAMPQSHCFKVMELAIRVQAMADAAALSNKAVVSSNHGKSE